MKAKSRKSGLTLTEMLVVTACVAVLVGFGVPAVRAVLESFESPGATQAMISSALASARAMALKEQRYVGVRFQHAYDPDRPDVVDWPQYLVFIMHDPEIGAHCFRAVRGLKPIRLPDSVGVTDLTIVYARKPGSPVSSEELALYEDAPGLTDEKRDLTLKYAMGVADVTTFSVIFSPSGKLVVQGLYVRNRDGYTESQSASKDDIFNKRAAVSGGVGMFYQDDYSQLGLGAERSRMGFWVYDRKKFKKAYEGRRPYTGYFKQLVFEGKMVRINAYTGTIISKD